MQPPEISAEQAEARRYFPRGMAQPRHGYRFSQDPLLLSCFASIPAKGRGLDLGTGCGVLSFAALLRTQNMTQLHISGMDSSQEMIEAASTNAERLGLAKCFTPYLNDVRSYDLGDNHFDFALCNPPFRKIGRGRVNPEPSRASARFEEQGEFVDFCRAAKRGLKDKAPLYLVHHPERLLDILAVLQAEKLEPRRGLFVHGYWGAPARMLFLEARKNGGESFTMESPLFLYTRSAPDAAITEEALAFCPYLHSNARK